MGVSQLSISPHMMKSCWTLMFKAVHLHQCDVLKDLTEDIFTRSQGPIQMITMATEEIIINIILVER